MIVIMGMVAVGADTANMVVMADLGLADVVFISDDLLAVFAKLAVHDVVAREHFLDPVGEGLQQHGVIVQVPGFQNFHARVGARCFICPVIYALYQNAGEQEVGENDYSPVAQLYGLGETGVDQRVGDT